MLAVLTYPAEPSAPRQSHSERRLVVLDVVEPGRGRGAQAGAQRVRLGSLIRPVHSQCKLSL